MNSCPPLFADPRISSQITHVEELEPKEATFGHVREPMHAHLRSKLGELGIADLYSHQAEAYDAVAVGRNVVVVTGTNSGKTLCYNLPALQACLSEPAARCLFLFPTKALAQDQLGKLEELAPSGTRVGTYDGDTPKAHRAPLRKMGNIILTNPDMLHLGILPSHELWARFLKSLRLIVVDEMHVYRGVFGSNVGNVLRRLLRLCEWHRSRPQIIACSATIGNPLELFERLTGREAVLIDNDGSPSGKRTFVFWNPPEVGEGARLSANVATSEILASLAENGMRTLAFSRARISAELVLRHTRKRIKDGGIVPENAVESYRAGYTAKDRRKIETDLFKGKLLGLSATNAMELGVDVGALDAVILNGYPGTASSFWQQSGRAGRGRRDGLAIFVAHNDPLEQFLVRKPSLLLRSRNESVAANPGNPQILSQHLLCAAHERPLAPSELERFGSEALALAEALDRGGELQFSAGLFFYPGVEPPAFRVNIRGSGGDQVRLYLDGVELGSMERWRAMTSAHEGAVYLHRGSGYLVTSLDLDAARADVVPMEADYYTQSIVQSVIDPRFAFRELKFKSSYVGLCGVTVTDVVVGYRQKSLDGDTVLNTVSLDLPPVTYDTVAIRVDLPDFDLDGNVAGQIGGVHAMEHAMLAVAPLMAGCDRGDLGSAWYTVFPDTMRPSIFVFDSTPGGVGLCEKLFESFTGWISAAAQLLRTCDCESGCPGCTLSPRCESNNESLDKQHAMGALNSLLD